MTATEAIRLLHPDTTSDAIRDIRYDCRSNGGRDVAIAAIEEACIIACRALETISELEKRGITVDTINEYKIFEDECVRKGFTFESLLEAREKQTPKKTYIQQDDRNNDCIECPSCDSFIGYEYDCRDEHYQINYCPYCGQALDWSEEE